MTHNIVHEGARHWVHKTPKGTFEVYRIGVTASTRCAIIGFTGADGMRRAIAEVERRDNLGL